MEIARRETTRFKREFKAFLAAIDFRLKQFLPDEYFGEKMFPDCLIPRATGYDKLRGQGRLSEELAQLWARRAQRFLDLALESAKRSEEPLRFDGISFVDEEGGRAQVNARKLMALYHEEWQVPVRVKVKESIDDAQMAAIVTALRDVVGDTQIVVARVREGCTEHTLLVPGAQAAQIIARFPVPPASGARVEVREVVLPPCGSLARSLHLSGPAIDLGAPGAAGRFEKAWRRAVRIESFVRPWRRLRWLVSPSLRRSPAAQMVGESAQRAYGADLAGQWDGLKTDMNITCIAWPLFAALSLAVALRALCAFFPFIDVGAGVATGLALSLAGAQICASVLGPLASGAGTIVLCWAFGAAQAFAIGSIGNAGSLSRSYIQQDLFTSVAGGIVGLAARGWSAHLALPLVILLLAAIATAITATGWLVAQPARAVAAGGSPQSRARLLLGVLAGSSMGAGGILVWLVSNCLCRLACPAPAAFILAFAAVGGATFALTLRLRFGSISKSKLAVFALSYALLACILCDLAYEQAGSSVGLLALAASCGWFNATWFAAASIVGERIGSTRAAVGATTVEGAMGFTGFVLFRLLHG